jgi:hypothetical protein
MKRHRNDERGYKRGERGKYIEQAGVVRGSGFNYGGAGTNKKGVGAYTSDDSGLTNKLPYEATCDSHDIDSNVTANQLDDRTGPVKFGVD